MPGSETDFINTMAVSPALTVRAAVSTTRAKVEDAEPETKKRKTGDPSQHKETGDTVQSRWMTLGAKEVSLIEERQKKIDVFIRQNSITPLAQVKTRNKTSSKLSVSAEAHQPQAITTLAVNSTTTTTEKDSAPMVATAIFADQSVSILMRTMHNPIVRDQELTLSTPLKPFERPHKLEEHDAIDVAMRVSVSPCAAALARDTHILTSSNRDGFDTFSREYKQLQKEIDHVTGVIGKLLPTAKQADDDFAKYRPEALDFFDHFVAMLSGVDPIITATKGMLQLPLDYHQQLAGKTAELFKALGLSEDTSAIIEPIFDCISKTKEAVDDFANKKVTLKDAAVKATDLYQVWHKHVAQICSSDRFPKSHGAGVTDLSSFLNSLSRQLNSILTCFSRLYEMGERAFSAGEDQIKDPKSRENILKRLNDTYKELFPIVARVVADVHDMPDLIWSLYGSLELIHKDLVLFFKASSTVAEQCVKLELEVMAADRVRSLCDRISASFGPLRKLFGEPQVNSTANQYGGDKPYGDFCDFFTELIYAGITVLLDKHFKLEHLTDDINGLNNLLQHPAEEHLQQFDDSLQKLVDFLNRKEVNLYTPKTSSDDSQSGLLVPIANPVMKEETATELGKILQEITVLSDGIKFTTKEEVTAKTIRTPKWSRDGINQSKIDLVAVKSWGMAWDKVEPQFPSHVFIAWYELLQGLDELMRDRAPWQRTRGEDPPPALPAPFKPNTSEAEVWSLLERKALIGASAYDEAILKSLQKPLHDRIQQLMREPFPLKPVPDTDLLKLLPLPQPGLDVPIEGLPLTAAKIAESAFKGKPLPKSEPLPNGNPLPTGIAVPEDLEVLFGQQGRFENIRRGLIPRVMAAGSVSGLSLPPVDAFTKALGEMHTDYNCMDARMLLELTADEATTNKFTNAVGVEVKEKV